MKGKHQHITKIFSLGLALLLLTITAGIKINVHYCENSLVNVATTSDHQSCCSELPDNCCDIVTEIVVLEEDYLPIDENRHIKPITHQFKSLQNTTWFHSQPKPKRRLLQRHHLPPPDFQSELQCFLC